MLGCPQPLGVHSSGSWLVSRAGEWTTMEPSHEYLTMLVKPANMATQLGFPFTTPAPHTAHLPHDATHCLMNLSSRAPCSFSSQATSSSTVDGTLSFKAQMECWLASILNTEARSIRSLVSPLRAPWCGVYLPLMVPGPSYHGLSISPASGTGLSSL